MTYRHALRALAPMLLLLLTACSDEKQAVSMYSEVSKQNHPGVGGVIDDALGNKTGNKEIDAAIDATKPIRDLERRDKAHDALMTALAAGDKKEADARLRELGDLGQTDETPLDKLRYSLQFGEPDAVDRLADVQDKAKADGDSMYFTTAIFSTQRTLRELGAMGLLPKEMRHRQVQTALALAKLYRGRAAYYREQAGSPDQKDLSKNFLNLANLDDQSAQNYEQMAVGLSSEPS